MVKLNLLALVVQQVVVEQPWVGVLQTTFASSLFPKSSLAYAIHQRTPPDMHDVLRLVAVGLDTRWIFE